jgi:hypothetical protein
MCTAQYVVVQEDVNVGRFVNVARAQAHAPGTTTTTQSNDASFALPIPSLPALALAKSAIDGSGDGDDDGLAEVGERIVWTFDVTNTGNSTLNELTITDATAPPITGEATALEPVAVVQCMSAADRITPADALRGSIANTATATAVDQVGTLIASPPATATVSIAAAEPHTTGVHAGRSALARTGVDVASFLASALLFAAVGLAFVSVRRHTRRVRL